MFKTKSFETIAEVENWLGRQLKRPAIQRRYGPELRLPICFKDGRGRRSACYWKDERTLVFPKWSRSPPVILHEAAHLIAGRKYGERIAGHGWQWCSIYLDLVGFSLGQPARKELKAAFKAKRVRAGAPGRPVAAAHVAPVRRPLSL
jgi:putative metallohydrolase (TIGR04338 family)